MSSVILNIQVLFEYKTEEILPNFKDLVLFNEDEIEKIYNVECHNFSFREVPKTRAAIFEIDLKM